MNIILIGYRGSGKSAVGQELARRLRWPLLDTDDLIVERAGRSIRDIFALQGENAFRQIEADVVAEAAARDGHIISTGGGVVLRPENLERLKGSGTVVWLSAPPDVLWLRITSDAGSASSRPDLTASGGLEEIRQVLEQRRPLYEAPADLVVDVGSRSVAEAAGEILSHLRPEPRAGTEGA